MTDDSQVTGGEAATSSSPPLDRHEWLQFVPDFDQVFLATQDLGDVFVSQG